MKRVWLILVGLVLAGVMGWAGLRWSGKVPMTWAARLKLPGSTAKAGENIPTTVVKRGDVTFTVTARGDLQGGNSEMLSAPMVGGAELVLTSLRRSGDVVQEGDVVAQFDTTEQEFKLREAEADLAEAEQQVAQAEADSQAKAEETEYSLLQARTDLKLAELEARKNPLLATIQARQNTLAVEAARDRLNQLEHDYSSRQATSKAGIAIQEANRVKAKVKADTARRNIENMTLRAHTSGYVSLLQNQSGGIFYTGMVLPLYQVGDTVRPGMAVAQIPDLKNWEVSARISELDRGHIEMGQTVEISVVALPGKKFSGKIKNLGNTTGAPWDRRFDCRMTLEDPSPELRPGMTANIVITTETLANVLWLPSQALFESDGRAFVYQRTPTGFVPHDVKLVRRSESRAVITGIQEGQAVALANPEQPNKKQGAPGNALQAIPK